MTLAFSLPDHQAVGLHRGMVDNTPDISDMPRYHCNRYLTVRKMVDSPAIQIHCSDAVIIGSITTAPAPEDMHLLIAAGFLRVTTDRTGPARITGIYIDHGTLVQNSLVLQFLFQVMERPRNLKHSGLCDAPF